MVSFENDYNVGMHPKILEALAKTNLIPQSGYGSDEYTLKAKENIRKVLGSDDNEIFLLAGGTQTNAIVIDSLLKDYEGVVACSSGHIAVHEAGAVEHAGRKVLEIPEVDGKVDSKLLDKYVSTFYGDDNREHMVFPGMVYLSYPTEKGTLYSKQELLDVADVCKKYNMKLFLDGARLGYGLMSKSSDLTIQDIASICDVFYIGGTKVGAIIGEAIVFKKECAPKHFVNFIKKRGALLAKGRLVGLQFATLFENNLYFDISKNAMDKAEKLKEIIVKKGYSPYIVSPTNQQFIVLENSKMQELAKHIKFSFWENIDENHTAIRLVTSWATSDNDLAELEKYL